MHIHHVRQDSSDFSSLSTQERFRYFLNSVIESEEVWSLGTDNGWMIKDLNDAPVVPVWPRPEPARRCITSDLQDHVPNAVSLEHFLYTVLQVMKEQGIKVEIFPTGEENGLIMNARDLAAQFESLLDSGEYFLEG